MTLHPKYHDEFKYYMSMGMSIANFEKYFSSKIEFYQQLEFTDAHKKVFKTELMKYRGYDEIDLEQLEDLNEKHRLTDLIGSIMQLRNYIASDTLVELEKILPKAIEFEQFNIQMKLNKKEENVFTGLRKLLRACLSDDAISSTTKLIMRKIVNEIHFFIKIEFAPIKCDRDHLEKNEAQKDKRSSSPVLHEPCKRVKLNRSNFIPSLAENENIDSSMP